MIFWQIGIIYVKKRIENLSSVHEYKNSCLKIRYIQITTLFFIYILIKEKNSIREKKNLI